MATKQNSVVYAARGGSALREEMPSLACDVGGVPEGIRGGERYIWARWDGGIPRHGTPFFVRAPNSLGHARRQRTLRASWRLSLT